MGALPLLGAVVSLSDGVPADGGVRRGVVIGVAGVLLLIGVTLTWVTAGRACVNVAGTVRLGPIDQQLTVLARLLQGRPVYPGLRARAASRVAVAQQTAPINGVTLAATAALLLTTGTDAHIPQLGDLWPPTAAVLVWLGMWLLTSAVLRRGTELGLTPAVAAGPTPRPARPGSAPSSPV